MVEPITRSCRKKIRFSSVDPGVGPGGRPRDHHRAAGLQRAQRVVQVAAPTVSITASTRSGSRARGLERLVGHRVDGRGCRLAPLRLVTQTRRPITRAEPDHRRRDAAAGALHQHGVAGLQPGAGGQHAVGGQPRGRQARGLARATARSALARVAPRTTTCSARVPWCSSDSSVRRGSRVSSPRSRVPDDGVHHDLGAVVVQSRRIAAEDHGQPVGGQADPAQAPQVVVVEAGGLDPDAGPSSGTSGAGPSPTTRPDSGSSGAMRAT